MPDEDAIEEGGLEPAAEEPTTDVALAEPEVEVEEEPTFRLSEIAEALPHFDRFAKDHQGIDALRQYGGAYDNSRRLISQGGHLTRQEEDAYRAAGIDPAEVQVPQQEEPEAPGLWGVPWQVPTTWEEVQQYAGSDDPEARRLAWVAVAQEPSAPENVKQAYFAHWAQIDPAGATLYNQQAMQAALDARMAEVEARIEERYGKTHEDLVSRNVTSLMETAKTQIPGFQEHAAGVQALFNANAENYPGFQERFFNATLADQLTELRRLTIIAAAEAAPARQASAANAADATDAAKQRARTETSRTSTPADDAAALKQQSLDEAKRVFGQVR